MSPRPEWWEPQVLPPVPEGYLDMIEQVRDLLNALAAAVPDAPSVAEVTSDLLELTTRLDEFAVDETHQLSGRLTEAPGRGQTLVPPVHVERVDATSLECSITYPRHYLGGHGAVHGGAVPLLFDDVLGRFAQTGGRPISRTAYLHVDYRSITPVDKPLRLIAEFVEEHGRKKVLRGRLFDGDVLCAEAEGLFVVLNPGQP